MSNASRLSVDTTAARRALATFAATSLVATMLGAGVAGATIGTPSTPTGPGAIAGSDAALTVPFALTDDRDVDDRLPQPEDRYALAGGCYTMQTTDGYLGRSGADLVRDAAAADAAPFLLQATELGRYLIVADEGLSTEVDGAWWSDRSYLSAGLMLAAAPSTAGDWLVAAMGEDADARDEAGQPYALTLPDDASGATLTDVRFHLADSCAIWPEITTNTSGEPSKNPDGAAASVRGFFEAHVHGMAYEFLGGKLRCGQPWHRWGVEYALPDCAADGSNLNGVLEVGLSGASPDSPFTTYDSVGWPTFATWPTYETLTHEQYYYKWLERAYHGGLRLTTILLVENTALCQLYPEKKNSCNEMDSVRLQAQRMFQLQEYIDAQSGGPGEGWLRIVTTPAQARRTANDGRLAIVLGIETSELFDCREVLDQPQCTAESIATSLTEVVDMGVRQMELLNKFDSALAGVTGDGGTTGVAVNAGQKLVSGHFWDMRTCPEPTPDENGGGGHNHAGTQTDKLQLNAGDDIGGGNGPEEVDVLAGTILSMFGPASGPTPVYPSGPHCNARGLTDLGAQLITQMAERGILFDPDHMSALAQRQALDLLQDVVTPAMHAAADAAGTPRRIPGILSSHSWGNDVIYQRIFEMDGVVAPRTTSAYRFVDRWVERRAWHAAHAPDRAFFGLGYGADTNGLGGQPGPSGDLIDKITYGPEGFKAPIGDVTIFQQVSGVHSYDINTDGVAHYGLFADWFQEIIRSAHQQLGADAAAQIEDDMLNGAEDYLRTWERAVYGGNGCVVDGSAPQLEDIHALLGGELDLFLRSIGQPVDRDGSAFIYCVAGENGTPETIRVEFDDDGDAVSAEGLGPADDSVVKGVSADHDDPLAATGGGAVGMAAMLLGGAALLAGTARRGRRAA